MQSLSCLEVTSQGGPSPHAPGPMSTQPSGAKQNQSLDLFIIRKGRCSLAALLGSERFNILKAELQPLHNAYCVPGTGTMGRSGLGGGDSGDPGDGQKEHLPTGRA